MGKAELRRFWNSHCRADSLRSTVTCVSVSMKRLTYDRFGSGAARFRRDCASLLFAVLCAAIICAAAVSGACSTVWASEYLYLEPPTGGIATYRIEKDGSLALTGSVKPHWPRNVRSPSPPGVVFAIRPGGRIAFSSPLVGYSFLLQRYTVDPSNGVLKRDRPKASTQIRFEGSLTFSPNGRFLYINDAAGTTPYKINTATGEPTISGAKVAFAIYPIFSRSANYAYGLRSGANNVASYRVRANGSLSLISSSLVPTGAGANSLVVDPGGSFAYVANSSDDTISQYFIDPHNGVLRSNPKNSTIVAPRDPGSLIINASGRYLYGITNSERKAFAEFHSSIFQYRIGSDGQLESLGDSLALSGPAWSMAADPSGKFLYVAIGRPSKGTYSPTQLYGFGIQSDGRLKKLQFPGIPILQGAGPVISWIGAKPSVRVAHRSVADLLRIKPPTHGIFKLVGRMDKTRNWRAVATVLPDGRVFFLEYDLRARAHGEIFNPRTNTFSACKIPAGVSRGYLAARLRNNQFLIGNWGEPRFSIFDARTMTLISSGHLERKCYSLPFLLPDGRILFHYFPGRGRFRRCEGAIYNPVTDKSAPEPAGLQRFTILAQLKGNRFLVFPTPRDWRVINPQNWPKTEAVSVYDLTTNHVTSVGNIPGSLAWYSKHLLLRDGRVLFVGMVPKRGLVELFDPKHRKFDTIGPLARPHGMGLSLTQLKDGRVLIAGGYARTNAELLDLATKKFTLTGSMIECNGARGILLHNGTVLFAGGVYDGRGWSDDNAPRDGAEIYYPPKR